MNEVDGSKSPCPWRPRRPKMLTQRDAARKKKNEQTESKQYTIAQQLPLLSRVYLSKQRYTFIETFDFNKP